MSKPVVVTGIILALAVAGFAGFVIYGSVGEKPKFRDEIILVTLPPLILAIIGFAFFVVREHVKSGNEKMLIHDRLLHEKTDFSQLTGISRQPVILFFNTKLVDCHVDGQSLYVSKDGETAKFPLGNITEIGKTSMLVNRCYVWQIKVKDVDGGELAFCFMPNVTLWNKSFPNFLETMNGINPSAVKSKFHWWNF